MVRRKGKGWHGESERHSIAAKKGHRGSVGFTGTSKGMTEKQEKEVSHLLTKLKKDHTELHHGDCIGADAQAHKLAKCAKMKVVKHPPINPKARAFSKGGKTLPEKDYLKRNRDIVDAADILIATPKGKKEEIRSGTWATIRYAKKKKKKIKIIYP